MLANYGVKFQNKTPVARWKDETNGHLRGNPAGDWTAFVEFANTTEYAWLWDHP